MALVAQLPAWPSRRSRLTRLSTGLRRRAGVWVLFRPFPSGFSSVRRGVWSRKPAQSRLAISWSTGTITRTRMPNTEFAVRLPLDG